MSVIVGLRAGVLAALAVFGAVCGYAQDLKTYRGIYEKSLAGFVTEQKTQARALSDKYLATLDLLQKKAQQAGNLDFLLTVTEEMGRVTKGEPLADKDELGAKFAELKAVRVQYEAAARLADGATARKIGDLTQRYEKLLAGLQADLTRKGQLDGATAVKAEREGLEAARSEVAWAKALLTGTATAGALAPAPASGVKPEAALPSEPVVNGKSGGDKDLYLVIDLSRGTKAAKYPVKYLAQIPKGGWDDEYKTEKLVLRKIESGKFLMGSPEDELGRKTETRHEVTLTKAFYIGVFEVTQRQWELVMGNRPSIFKDAICYAVRPVEKVGYSDIRGMTAGAGWPVSGAVDSDSFMGVMRAKTGFLSFDLPTEAQWEYAGRAGTTSALNSGKNLVSIEEDPGMAEVGRYKYNGGEGNARGDLSSGTARVGSYTPNAWDLYDIHGNVWEMCLDWMDAYSGLASDPKGASSGTKRVNRGGSWANDAPSCRSSNRGGSAPESTGGGRVGFRVAMTLP